MVEPVPTLKSGIQPRVQGPLYKSPIILLMAVTSKASVTITGEEGQNEGYLSYTNVAY
jgi:hypothetical protein